jgi:hypothetical protein
MQLLASQMKGGNAVFNLDMRVPVSSGVHNLHHQLLALPLAVGRTARRSNRGRQAAAFTVMFVQHADVQEVGSHWRAS